VFAIKKKGDVFPGNVTALQGPIHPAPLSQRRLFAWIPLYSTHSNGIGTPSVTCGLPSTLRDAVTVRLSVCGDAPRMQETRDHEPDTCCYALGHSMSRASS